MKKITSVDIRHECTISSMIDHERSEWSIMLEIVHEWRISTRVNFWMVSIRQMAHSKLGLNVLTFFIRRPLDFPFVKVMIFHVFRPVLLTFQNHNRLKVFEGFVKFLNYFWRLTIFFYQIGINFEALLIIIFTKFVDGGDMPKLS